MYFGERIRTTRELLGITRAVREKKKKFSFPRQPGQDSIRELTIRAKQTLLFHNWLGRGLVVITVMGGSQADNFYDIIRLRLWTHALRNNRINLYSVYLSGWGKSQQDIFFTGLRRLSSTQKRITPGCWKGMTERNVSAECRTAFVGIFWQKTCRTIRRGCEVLDHWSRESICQLNKKIFNGLCGIIRCFCWYSIYSRSFLYELIQNHLSQLRIEARKIYTYLEVNIGTKVKVRVQHSGVMNQPGIIMERPRESTMLQKVERTWSMPIPFPKWRNDRFTGNLGPMGFLKSPTGPRPAIHGWSIQNLQFTKRLGRKAEYLLY